MVISKIESVKPSNYDDIKNKVAQVSYVQAVMDKLVEKINEKFVSQLNDILTEERSKLKELITKVGNETEGLIKEINDLKEQVTQILPEEAPLYINTAGEYTLL